MSKSSIRAIRERTAARMDVAQLVRPKGNAEYFLAGFSYVQEDLLRGLTADESFDLACSKTDQPQAFRDGADAARHMYTAERHNGPVVQGLRNTAKRLAAQYKVELP